MEFEATKVVQNVLDTVLEMADGRFDGKHRTLAHATDRTSELLGVEVKTIEWLIDTDLEYADDTGVTSLFQALSDEVTEPAEAPC